eukprot:scpid21150/ scgid1689/ Putative ferric-chelate reductase 1
MSQQWRTLPAPLVLSIASGVLLLLLCRHASGLPTGAPTEACDNMTPNHRTHSQGGDGGYQIYHNIGTAYRAGNKYNISINGTENPEFRGFFCQVRTEDGDNAASAVGTFVNGSFAPNDGGTRLSSCAPASIGVTHTNNLDKEYRSFIWQAPAVGTGPVQIWCSFVKVKLLFWVHVKSDVIQENTTGVTTQPPVVVTTHPTSGGFNLSACGASIGCYRSPAGCSGVADCDVIVTQQVVGSSDSVIFELAASADGWVALGLNSIAKMQGAQAMGCQRASDSGAEVNVKNTHNVAQRTNEPIEPGDVQHGLTLLSSAYTNGVIQCRFQRKFAGSSTGERTLGHDVKLHYLIAINQMSSGVAPKDKPFLLKHNLDPIKLDSFAVTDLMNIGATVPTTQPPVTTTPGPTTTPATTVPAAPTPSASPVVNIDLARCGESLGCYRSPDGCRSVEECDAIVTQEVNTADKTVVFSLSAKSDGWVALGLNSESQMAGTQAMGCQRESDSSSHVNVKNTANDPSQYANLPVDANNLQTGLLLLAASYQEGRIMCQFRRAFSTSDSKEKELGSDKPYHYIIAMNTDSSAAEPAHVPLLNKHNQDPVVLDPFTVTDLMNVGAGKMVDLTGCGTSKGCAVYPGGCANYGCEYAYTQEVQGDMLSIQLWGRSQGWLAIGYNDRRLMDGADVVACQLSDDGNVYAKKGHNIKIGDALNNTLDNSSDPTVGLTNITAVSQNGYLYCTLSRSLTGWNGIDITKPLYLMFAKNANGTAPPDTGVLHKHTDTPAIPNDKFSTATPFSIVVNGTSQEFTKIDLSGCGSVKGCLRLPNGCDLDDCHTIYTQQVRVEGYLDIELYSVQQGWVAVGFNDAAEMSGADVIGCQNFNNFVTAKSLYNQGHANMLKDPSNVAGNLSNMETTFTGHHIACRVRRAIRPSKPHYRDLSQPYHVIVAFADASATAPASKALTVKHTTVPVVSKTKMVASDRTNIGSKSNTWLLKIHGSVMIFVWIGLSSMGIVLPITFKTRTFRDATTWFKLHRGTMVTVWCLTMVGVAFPLIYSTKMVISTHVILGIVTASLCFIQPFLALLRPHPGEPRRTAWNGVHGVVGISAQTAAFFAIYFGYNKAFTQFFCYSHIVNDVLLAAIGINAAFIVLAFATRILTEWITDDAEGGGLEKTPLVAEGKSTSSYGPPASRVTEVSAGEAQRHSSSIQNGRVERRSMCKLMWILLHTILALVLAAALILSVAWSREACAVL